MISATVAATPENHGGPVAEGLAAARIWERPARPSLIPADGVISLLSRVRSFGKSVHAIILIGLIVYLTVGAALFENLTGAAETASIIPFSSCLSSWWRGSSPRGKAS